MSNENVQVAEKILQGFEVKKISQGAEAIVFISNKHPYNTSNTMTIIKYRPKKPYRYPILDKKIIKQRTVLESKILAKLFRSTVVEFNKFKCDKESNSILNGGVNCPRLYGLDVVNGLIYMEHVNFELPSGKSSSLKNYLWYLEQKFSDSLDVKLTVKNCEEIVESKPRQEIASLDRSVESLLRIVGVQLANLHLFGFIHGDLTSSNIVLKDFEAPYLIDFGLSYQSILPEDKAVDLYVLEKALGSTHPLFAEKYSQWILAGYQEGYQLKGVRENNKKIYRSLLAEVLKRLEAVRLRGRKRSMIG